MEDNVDDYSPPERKNGIIIKKQSIQNYMNSQNSNKKIEIQKKFTDKEIGESMSFQLIHNNKLPRAPKFSKKQKSYKNGILMVGIIMFISF